MPDSTEIEQLQAQLDHANTKIESLRIATLISSMAGASLGDVLAKVQLDDVDRALVDQATADFKKIASRLSGGAEGEE